MRLRVIVLIVVSSISNGMFGQQRNLQILDSVAFAGLESNSPDVTKKAQQLLIKAQEDSSALHQINALTILGIVNKNKGYYITSLNHYLKALSIAKARGDKARESACLNNIGSIYHLQGNHSEALSFFNRSLQIEDQLKKPLQKSIRYYNIGDVYNDVDSLSLALNYYTNSLIIEKNEGNEEGVVFANLGICEIYLKSNRLTDAQDLLLNTKDWVGAENVEESIMYYTLLAELAKKEGKLSNSMVSLNMAESISKKNDIRTYLPSILSNQIEIFEENENWLLASMKYKELIELNSELNNIKIKNQLADLTFQNEIKASELELQLTKEERDLAVKNEQMEKNIAGYSKKITWFLVMSLIALIALMILGFKKLFEG